jgi:glutaredoxin/uncharacterized membrane protein
VKKFRVILPILLLIYITVETYLKSRGIEACSTTGCALAGELLKFNSTYLNYLGVLAAASLAVIALLRGEFFSKLYTVVVASMVIFESLLIASQININPEPCIFCLGVYSFLLITLFIASPKVFGYSLPAVLAVFVAFSFLSIPKNKSLIKEDGLYLISSKTCPHCKKTKEFLNKEGIKYKVITAKDTNAWYFAKSLNIKKIPIAIEAKGGSFSVTVGDRDIIEKFSKKQQKAKEQESPKQEATNTASQSYQEPLRPKLNLSGDEGCGYSIIQESSCEGEDGTSK